MLLALKFRRLKKNGEMGNNARIFWIQYGTHKEIAPSGIDSSPLKGNRVLILVGGSGKYVIWEYIHNEVEDLNEIKVYSKIADENIMCNISQRIKVKLLLKVKMILK